MLTNLRFYALLAFVAMFFAGPVAASHLQGGDLTYAPLGNNRYRVTLHVYRDCSGITPSAFTLECRSGGCNTTANITTPFVQVGVPTTGRQYCATLSGICTGGGPTNTEAYTYTAEVTLPPAARWTLSTSQNARPNTANLDLGNSSDMYLEATLNNLLPGGAAVSNTSPVASTLPVAFVPWNRLSTVSNNAFDADGDSLVYSMQAPLAACGTPATYAAYIGNGTPTITLTTNPLCILQVSQTSGLFSPTLPIYVGYDINGQCPIKTATPRFSFDARTGSIELEPSRYTNTASALGENKYAAVVKITEYRRISGRYVEVGTMRRELYFIVYDCGPNSLPLIAPTVTVQTGIGTGSQNTVQPIGTIIPAVAGEPVSVLVNATDPNSGQTLTLTLDYNATPGAVLQNLGNGQARLTFTPALTSAAGLYYVAVTAEDDACPIKGLNTQLLTFRVGTTALATVKSAVLAVPAYPTPFTDQVRFQLATPGVQTLTVFDNLGRPVATLRSQPDGSVRWQPAASLPAGLYLARTADGQHSVRLLRSGAQ